MLPFIKIGHFIIPTYILTLSLIYSAGIYYVSLKTKRTNFSRSHALDLCLIVMIGGFLGARLFHVFYENPDHYIKSPLSALKIWRGGFVFYGGAIGAFIGTFIYTKYQKLNSGQWLDFFTPIVCVGYGFGRLACLLNGCCYGFQCDLPWAIDSKHPAQLYATLLEIILFIFLTILIPKCKELRYSWSQVPLKRNGQLFFIWLTGHSLNRLIMEQFRADDRGNFLGPFSISTILSFAFIIIGVIGTIGYIRITRDHVSNTD